MRLTAELISRAKRGFNPLDERELVLRSAQIAMIENLGATLDQFDCLDLSDNLIARLDNMPLLRRLQSLLMAENVVTYVASGLGARLPHLRMLVLTQNRVSSLAVLDALADLPSLQFLSLLHNPVTRLPHYRLYAIYRLPRLATLDFARVKPAERKAARAFFASVEGKKLVAEVAVEKRRLDADAAAASLADAEADAAAAAAAGPSSEDAADAAAAAAPSSLPSAAPAAAGGGGASGASSASRLTASQIVRLRAAIDAASSMEEFDMLQRCVEEGRLPDGWEA